MGNQPPPKKFDPMQDKLKFEIACIKMKGYVELMRDRKQNEINMKEKQLIKMISGPNRQKLDEFAKAQSIVSDINVLNACNFVLRFAEILKDRSMQIVQARGKPELIQDLIPFIESIIWSTSRLNLSSIQEFSALVTLYFGPKIYESVQKSTNVNEDLKKCYQNLLPTNDEVNNFIISFSKRQGLSLELINQAGVIFFFHEFYPDGQKPGNGGCALQNNQFVETPTIPNQPINQNFAFVAYPGGMPPQQQPQFQQQYPQYPQYPQQQQPQQPQYPQYPQYPQQQPYQPQQQLHDYPQYQPPIAPQQFQKQPEPQMPQYPGLDGINVPSYNSIMKQNPQQPIQKEFVKTDQQHQQSPVSAPVPNNLPQQTPGQNQQTAQNDLPNLDDFEARMRKLRDNL